MGNAVLGADDGYRSGSDQGGIAGLHPERLAAGPADRAESASQGRTSPGTRRSFLATAAAVATSAGVASLGQADALAVGKAPSTGGKRLTLLQFTDTHAQMETHQEYLPGAVPSFQEMGGFARLKTAIDRERETAAGACFLVDSGDEFQGSGPATWSEGRAVLAPLNALGADVFVPGNWEAAYGPERFRETMAALTSTVVCYNLHDQTTGQRLFRPSLTLERQGVKVAFVGVTDIFASKRQRPVEFQGLDTSRIEGLRDFVKELRRRDHPDVVVAVTHTGLSIARQMARDIPELDVVFSAHTHERTEKPILEGRVIVVEAGSMGSFLGRLDLTLDPAGGVAGHEFRLIPVHAERYPEDPEVKRLVEESLRPYRDRMRRVVGRTQTPLLRYDVLETNVDDLVSDALREATRADVGLSNGFRFGLPVLAGPIVEADVWNLLPMDARIKEGWVTGKELRQYLEHELELVFARDPYKLSGGWGPRASGLTMSYKARAVQGQRLVSVLVNGEPVQDDRRYTITGCEREGEPLDVVCRLRGTHEVRVLPRTIHQVLADYLKAHPVISPRRDGRSWAVDLRPVEFSQDALLHRTAGLA